jgi:pimeloyl-ACP methyl ester carboxylesterase
MTMVSRLTIFSLILFASVGCKSMTPGELDRVQPASDQPRAGNVYLLRGFIGIWSYGVDHLGRKIADSGVRASVFQEDQWSALANTIVERYRANPTPEPLVLIGHSYGADDTLRIAKVLQEHNIKIDLIITLDPVTPPQVPSNITLCYNIYQPSLLDSLPFFRGVALETESPNTANLVNVNIRADRTDLLEPGTDHFNIEKNELIHAEVVRKVHEFCPPRDLWATRRTGILRASNLPPAPSHIGRPPRDVSRIP